MSTADELENALTDVTREPKTEDSNYDDTLELNQDLDMDQKPDIDNDEPLTPQEDEDMEDLFGDDKPAEEIIHHEGSVSKVSRATRPRVLNAPGESIVPQRRLPLSMRTASLRLNESSERPSNTRKTTSRSRLRRKFSRIVPKSPTYPYQGPRTAM